MRLLFWSPIPILPVRTGSQARMAGMASSLRELGWEVHVFCPSWLRGFPSFSLPEEEAALHLWRPGIRDLVRAHVVHPFLRRLAPGLDPWTCLLGHRSRRKDLERAIQTVNPDVVWFHYGFSAVNLPSVAGRITVCDVLDLNSVNYAMQSSTLFRHHSDPMASWLAGMSTTKGLSRELDLLGRFSGRISISEADHGILTSHGLGTDTIHLPMSFPPVEVPESTPHLPAGMFLGDNPLNLAGLKWFADSVLPKILEVSPGFRVHLGGRICSRIRKPIRGIEITGAVQSPMQFYSRIGYAICPTFLGTGEQIKIGEAMSYGRPCIAFEWMSSPIVHQRNGFRVRTVDDWVEGILNLEANPALRMDMGERARLHLLQTRSSSSSTARLGRFLETLVGESPPRAGQNHPGRIPPQSEKG